MSDNDLEEALSYERFARYLAWTGGDRTQALALYTLNARLSEGLYISMQMLEVTLRNRIHVVMTDKHGEMWFKDHSLLILPHQQDQVLKAIADVENDGKEATSGRVVAALTFSFWTSMLSPAYDNLWQTTLHKIGKKPDGKGLRRKDFSSPLSPIRTLRNRTAHHEPIIAWDLPSHRQKLCTMIEWLSPAAAEWVNQNCRFFSIYPSQRILLLEDEGS